MNIGLKDTAVALVNTYTCSSHARNIQNNELVFFVNQFEKKMNMIENSMKEVKGFLKDMKNILRRIYRW